MATKFKAYKKVIKLTKVCTKCVGHWRCLASQWFLTATGFLRGQRSNAGGKRPGQKLNGYCCAVIIS